jgi:hypothetical protein
MKKFKNIMKQRIYESNYDFWIGLNIPSEYAKVLATNLFMYTFYQRGLITKEVLMGTAEKMKLKLVNY